MKKIDDIINISEDRKTAILRAIDPIARGDGDIVEALQGFIKDGLPQNNDELMFLSFMCGSVSGSQKSIQMMAMLGQLPQIDKKTAGKLLKKVSKELDEIVDKK